MVKRQISEKEITILLMTIPGVLVGFAVNDIVETDLSLDPWTILIIGVIMFLAVAYFMDR